MLSLDLVHTVAFSGIVLFVGYGLCRLIRPLSRYNIPAPVVGGLLVALIVLVARHYEVTLFQFDITLRDPLMIAFFTTIGFGASLSFLKVGGPQDIVESRMPEPKETAPIGEDQESYVLLKNRDLRHG